MDKETLAILISALSEMEIIELYKIKKINHFGFRVNTTNDVRKNRQMLESNLLKPINIKHIQGYFIFRAANSKIEIEGLSWNELQQLCESKGYLKVLIALYVNGKKADIKKVVNEYLKRSNKSLSECTLEIKDKNRVSETTYNKIIIKLEKKLINLTEEYQKKEDNNKSQLKNANKLILGLRKENTILKHDFNRVIRENKQLKQDIYTVTNENVNLKNVNVRLRKQNEVYNNEIQSLKKDISLMNEEIKQLHNNTSISTNKSTVEELDKQVIDTTDTYEIAVFGESNEIILNNIHNINFKFIEGEAIKEFNIEDYTSKYNEIWIIHYDLTQKEKRLVHMKNFEDIKKTKIKDIYSLKELNQIMVNLKKKRVI